jgi:hypothetical protein
VPSHCDRLRRGPHMRPLQNVFSFELLFCAWFVSVYVRDHLRNLRDDVAVSVVRQIVRVEALCEFYDPFNGHRLLLPPKYHQAATTAIPTMTSVSGMLDVIADASAPEQA